MREIIIHPQSAVKEKPAEVSVGSCGSLVVGSVILYEVHQVQVHLEFRHCYLLPRYTQLYFLDLLQDFHSGFPIHPLDISMHFSVA